MTGIPPHAVSQEQQQQLQQQRKAVFMTQVGGAVKEVQNFTSIS